MLGPAISSARQSDRNLCPRLRHQCALRRPAGLRIAADRGTPLVDVAHHEIRAQEAERAARPDERSAAASVHEVSVADDVATVVDAESDPLKGAPRATERRYGIPLPDDRLRGAHGGR